MVVSGLTVYSRCVFEENRLRMASSCVLKNSVARSL